MSRCTLNDSDGSVASFCVRSTTVSDYELMKLYSVQIISSDFLNSLMRETQQSRIYGRSINTQR